LNHSNNLVEWTPILNNTAAIGLIYVCDAEMTNFTQRFDLAILP